MNAPQEYLLAGHDEPRRLELQTLTEQSLITTLLEESGFTPNTFVLDLACGIGDVSVQIAQRLGPIGKVIGLDRDENHIITAKINSYQNKVKNAGFIRADASNIPFPQNTFDTVWSRYFLEYMKDPISNIKEMMRVVKPGGTIIIHDFDNWTFEGIDSRLKSKFDQIIMLMSEETGFDPKIGSKLVSYFQQVGIKNYQTYQHTHNQVRGKAPEAIVQDWQSRLSKMRPWALKTFNSEDDEADKFCSDMLAWIKDDENPEKYMHTNTYLIVGRVNEKEVNGLKLRIISQDDFSTVQTMAKESGFLRKKSWKKPPEDMIIDGLKSKKWQGYGLFDIEGKLVCYLDWKDYVDHVDIGFGMTGNEHRKQGLMSKMFEQFISIHGRKPITAGTSEKNGAILSVFKQFGFQHTETILDDRIDGQSTLKFRREPTPIQIKTI